jgi:DNA helicase-2/ATP-dependent DNA helicase PcrA
VDQRSELSRSGREIACITYTNAATDEIRRRIADDPLVRVSTIHDFQWSLIERHQAELREELVLHNRGLKRPFEDFDSLDPATRVTYSNRGRWFPDGQISHDDVIQLSKRMIARYPKLARLAADHYPYSARRD